MSAKGHGRSSAAGGLLPQIVAWETTRQCGLSCRHCRASATGSRPAGELTTEEGLRLISSLAALPIRLLILTGGEPMMRADIYDLARAAVAKGIRVVMAPCGPLLNAETAVLAREAGISAVSLSLDAADAAGHDAFRGVAGAFESALRGLRCARRAGLTVQINTTVTRLNVEQLPAIVALAEREGVATVDFFFLVPTGRGGALKDLQLDAEHAEQVLTWIAETDGTRGVRLKSTCAPQMARVRMQHGDAGRGGASGGCMAGRGFLFISHVGNVQPCGFLDMPCGNVRSAGFDMRSLLEAADGLRQLGEREQLGGYCGCCAYRQACGGCRARANAMTGSALGEEPFCAWAERHKSDRAGGSVPRRMDEDAIVTALQRGVPLETRPFAALGRTLGTTEEVVLGVLRRMLEDGSARRFGAVFDARRLGYRSELCAMDVPEADLCRIGAVVAAHPGVTHCYRRGHPPGVPPFPDRPDVASIPNLWFTLAVLRDSFAVEMALLEASVAPYAVWRLPAVRRFKIDVIFDPGRRDTGERVPGMGAVHTPADGDMERMTAADREIVQALEGNIPVRPDLFAGFTTGAGGGEAPLLERLRTWERTGTLRRIAMVVRHQRIGFTANAMCIWPVAADQIVEAGRRLAAWPEVTHCYARPVRPGWPYNLYAMIHTSDWGDTLRLFERIGESAGLAGGRFLGSLHEYKKTSMRYFAS